MTRLIFSLFLLAAVGLTPTLVRADETAQEVTLVLRNHRFEPERLTVPAGSKLILVLRNEDNTPEELESHDLKIEKVVAANKSIRVHLGPLKPGDYKFVGEYHEDTAKGVLIAQ